MKSNEGTTRRRGEGGSQFGRTRLQCRIPAITILKHRSPHWILLCISCRAEKNSHSRCRYHNAGCSVRRTMPLRGHRLKATRSKYTVREITFLYLCAMMSTVAECSHAAPPLLWTKSNPPGLNPGEIHKNLDLWKPMFRRNNPFILKEMCTPCSCFSWISEHEPFRGRNLHIMSDARGRLAEKHL